MKRLLTVIIPFLLFSACLSEEDSSPKIIGGKLSQQEYPFFASLYESSDLESSFCGASLIGSQFAVTAAHCVIDSFEALALASLGEFVEVLAVSMHPDFDEKHYANDIALLYFKSPETNLSDTDFIQIGFESEIFQQKSNNQARVIGLGNQTSFGSLFDDKLREVDVEVFPMTRCESVYESSNENINLCAGSSLGGKDSCQGDSGGPLFLPAIHPFETPQLLGLVSYGLGCAQAEYPGVYTKASAFKNWLQSEINFYHEAQNFSKKTFFEFARRFCYPTLSNVSSLESELSQLYLFDDASLTNASFKGNSLSPRGKKLKITTPRNRTLVALT